MPIDGFSRCVDAVAHAGRGRRKGCHFFAGSPGTRGFPETLPPIEYDEGEIVRRGGEDGCIPYGGRRWRVGKPFRGHDVALRPTRQDGELAVRFGAWRIAILDLPGQAMKACGLVDDASASTTTPQALRPL